MPFKALKISWKSRKPLTMNFAIKIRNIGKARDFFFPWCFMGMPFYSVLSKLRGNGGSKNYLQSPNLLLLKALTAAKSPQSCPTLCDPIDGSSPGSPIPGILQERTLEWVAISFSNTVAIFFSNAWKWKVKVKSLSRVWLLQPHGLHAAYQASPSMGFSRQEYWSGVPLPSPLKENCPQNW